jgi:hypothetical protein
MIPHCSLPLAPTKQKWDTKSGWQTLPAVQVQSMYMVHGNVTWTPFVAVISSAEEENCHTVSMSNVFWCRAACLTMWHSVTAGSNSCHRHQKQHCPGSCSLTDMMI